MDKMSANTVIAQGRKSKNLVTKTVLFCFMQHTIWIGLECILKIFFAKNAHLTYNCCVNLPLDAICCLDRTNRKWCMLNLHICVYKI